jgi:putative salt-induced outer membrane protein YdiY
MQGSSFKSAVVPRRTLGVRAFTARAVGLLLCVLPALLQADELILVNGDTLQGAVLREEADTLVWQSLLLGELRIPRSAVREIRPQSPTAAEPSAAVAPALPTAPVTDVATLTTNRLVSADVVSATESSGKKSPFPKRLTLTDVTLDFAGKDSTGNDEETSYSIDFNSKFRHLRNRHYLRVEYDAEEQDDVTTTDEQTYGYKYNYFIEGPWLGYLSALREENQLSDLQQRLTGSAGPGYEFYDTPTLRWALETGLAYNHENFKADTDRQFWGWHYGMDWRWLMSVRGLELFHYHALMQSFDQSDDWEIDSESGLRFQMVGRLKLVLKLKYDYDHSPAKDKEKTDRTWSVGLSYGI